MINSHKNLKEINDESKVFEFLTQGETDWDNIFEGFKEFKQNNNKFYGNFPTTLFSDKNLNLFDKMGIDYNYKDCYGNNFLHYIYKMKDEGYSLNFNKQCLIAQSFVDLVIGKTHDIYSLGQQEKSLLFYMIGHHNSGIVGEEFVKFCEKYPKFDLHAKDSNGKNLLHHALIKNSYPEVVSFLLKENVSTACVDEDKNTLLHTFPLVNYNKISIKLFNTLIKEIDITVKNTWNQTPLDDWKDFCLSDEVAAETKKSASYWMMNVCKKIINKDFLYTNKSLTNLAKIFNNRQTEYFNAVTKFLDEAPEAIKLYKQAYITIKCIKMELLLPEKIGSKKDIIKI